MGINLRSRLPKTARINRKVLAILGVIVAVVVLVSIIFGLRPHKNQVNVAETEANSLPSSEFLTQKVSYDDLFAQKQQASPGSSIAKPAGEDPGLAALRRELADLRSQLAKKEKMSYVEQHDQPLNTPVQTNEALEKAFVSNIFFDAPNAKIYPDSKPDNVPGSPGFDKEKYINEKLGSLGISKGDNPPSNMSLPGLNGIMESMPGGDNYKAQNDQTQKRDFLQKTGDVTAVYIQDKLHEPLSPHEVKAGSVIPCTLITGLNSDLPGDIVAQVRENVYDTVNGNNILIPQGTRVIGKYDSMVSYGQSRILLVFTRLIMPNGNSVSLEGMPGVDLSGYAGVSDRVNEHWLRLLTGVVLSAVLNASAAEVEESDKTDIYLKEGSRSFSKAGEKIVQRQLDVQPTLTVRPGWNFNVLVQKDMILEPYERI